MTMTRHAVGPANSTARPAPADSAWDRSVAARQLQAINMFNRHRRLAEEAAAASASTREMRMDAARRLEVLRRQHEAVVHRAHQQLRETGDLWLYGGPKRVVLAHRSDWFVNRVAGVLAGRGFQLVARADNGADAIGLTLCEQPEFVLVEDALAQVPGVEVVRELRILCPATRIVAQCQYSDGVRALLDAGAEAVYTRKIPPVDVAAAMADLVA